MLRGRKQEMDDKSLNRMARPEGLEPPTLCFEDKTATSRKALVYNGRPENKALSFHDGMCAVVPGCVHLIVGSLQKSLQCLRPSRSTLGTLKPP
jgi:hypothetical protein